MCKFYTILVKLLADYNGKGSPKHQEMNQHDTVSSPQNGKYTWSQGRIWKIDVKYMHFNAEVKG